jgi:hypothetical protein
MSISPAEFEALKSRKPAGNWRQHARGLSNHRRSEMNKTEAAYGLELSILQAAGKVEWFEFQPMRFRVGKDDSGRDAWYTPDWMVMQPDGNLEAVDCKGSGPIQEASYVRIRAAALLYPIRFVIAQQQRNGGFERREI